MPFFVLIPMWLGLLLCAAVLALFRGTRVLGLYVAASSTLALICSILVSTLAIVAMAKLSSFSQSAPWWMGLLLLIGYGGSILAGAVIGGVGGILLVTAIRVKIGQSRKGREAVTSSVRSLFGQES